MTDQAIIKSKDQRWAQPFEPPSAILTLSSASHFYRGHHNPCFPHVKSQFTRDFNLSHALLTLTELTFVDCDDYEIIRQGYNAQHGRFYLCFRCKRSHHVFNKQTANNSNSHILFTVSIAWGSTSDYYSLSI